VGGRNEGFWVGTEKYGDCWGEGCLYEKDEVSLARLE
jgi:hypothetical protein